MIYLMVSGCLEYLLSSNIIHCLRRSHHWPCRAEFEFMNDLATAKLLDSTLTISSNSATPTSDINDRFSSKVAAEFLRKV